jgi:hypothetical protein
MSTRPCRLLASGWSSLRPDTTDRQAWPAHRLEHSASALPSVLRQVAAVSAVLTLGFFDQCARS